MINFFGSISSQLRSISAMQNSLISSLFPEKIRARFRYWSGILLIVPIEFLGVLACDQSSKDEQLCLPKIDVFTDEIQTIRWVNQLTHLSSPNQHQGLERGLSRNPTVSSAQSISKTNHLWWQTWMESDQCAWWTVCILRRTCQKHHLEIVSRKAFLVP